MLGMYRLVTVDLSAARISASSGPCPVIISRVEITVPILFSSKTSAKLGMFS